MQEGVHRYDAAPINLERPLHYRREGNVDQVRGWNGRGKCRDISSVSQRLEGVGEGRIVN